MQVNRHTDSLHVEHIGMPIEEPLNTVGQRIRYARKMRGMTQPRLAALIGIKQGSLSDLETGETKEITGSVLIAISKALDVRAEWLSTGAGMIKKELRTEETDALQKLRDSIPEWRSYVLGLALIGREQQALILKTMGQTAQKPFEAAESARPVRETQLSSTLAENKQATQDAKIKRRTAG